MSFFNAGLQLIEGGLCDKNEWRQQHPSNSGTTLTIPFVNQKPPLPLQADACPSNNIHLFPNEKEGVTEILLECLQLCNPKIYSNRHASII
eukprot:CAMPEP_0183741744 /NCGR_PEP_ID=MMETSP0737-20130205/62910_1 /TAXON_ID=385413 /ORGANISM="Thalassiosira miniscula, Strain CCMP1093" /LENGTH=90 /DNA_ID=CAMNT_0025977171 /DNA_START=239 /DNA_END=512 /DNA_ORIENTATION=+